MTQRIVRVFPDAEAVSRAAAEEFVRLAREAVAARGQFTVALSGGSTPRRLYQLLAAPPYRDQVDWAHIQVLWGDERSVPPDDPQSNYHMARKALLEHVPIPADHIHRMEAERTDHDTSARAYQDTLSRIFFGKLAAMELPAFDLALLGMGPDGHTASLFPHTDALGETRRWVTFNNVPQLSTFRMTLTAPVLNHAREVLFLVAGADKAARLAEVLEGPSDPTRLPSQLIQPSPGKLVWFVDRAAAADLKTAVTGG